MGFWDFILDLVLSWIGEIWDALSSRVNDAIKDFVGWIGDFWDDIKDFWDDVTSHIGAWWSDTKKDIGEWWSDPLKDVGAWIDDKFKDVGAWWEDTLSDVKEWVIEYVGDLVVTFFTGVLDSMNQEFDKMEEEEKKAERGEGVT